MCHRCTCSTCLSPGNYSQPRLSGKRLYRSLRSLPPVIYPAIIINPVLLHHVTYITSHFQSPKSIHNYISGVTFLHRQLGLTSEAIDSFSIISLLHTADITHYVHTTTQAPTHHPTPSSPSLSPPNKPGTTGAARASVSDLRVLCHTQSKQPAPPPTHLPCSTHPDTPVKGT